MEHVNIVEECMFYFNFQSESMRMDVSSDSADNFFNQ